MLGATNFLNDFVKDEVKCRGLSVEDFGTEIDNEKNEDDFEKVQLEKLEEQSTDSNESIDEDNKDE